MVSGGLGRQRDPADEPVRALGARLRVDELQQDDARLLAWECEGAPRRAPQQSVVKFRQRGGGDPLLNEVRQRAEVIGRAARRRLGAAATEERLPS